MKTVLITASLTLVLCFVAQTRPVDAANASAPQANVDKSNDAGNDTGDSKVGALNSGQLDSNQKPAAPTTTGTTVAPKP